MGFKKNSKKKKLRKKKKKNRQSHTRENAKDLCGLAFGLHPQAETKRKFH